MEETQIPGKTWREEGGRGSRLVSVATVINRRDQIRGTQGDPVDKTVPQHNRCISSSSADD